MDIVKEEIDEEGIMARQGSSLRRPGYDKHDTLTQGEPKRNMFGKLLHIRGGSRYMSGHLYKKFAYQGQAWLTEMVSGFAFGVCGIIFMIISGDLANAGFIVLSIGILLTGHALYWCVKVKKTEKKTHSQKAKSHPDTIYESVPTTETV